MISINKTYRIFALIMAFVMFATSASYALNLHYCQGNLKSINLFGLSNDCCQKAENASMEACSSHQEKIDTVNESSISQTQCCNNQPLLLQSDQDQTNEFADVVVTEQFKKFVILYVAVFIQKDFIQKSAATFWQYNSPIISRDTYVLFQSFLL